MTEQEKREKVIKGLEACSLAGTKDDCIGYGCPYLIYNDEVSDDCQEQMFDDVLALLKAQEPRLVTESDFNSADEYGYIPVWTEEKDGDMYWECIPKAAITDPDGIEVLRYWTTRPDQATMEATPWERLN